jgi:putative heme-binding domain-containing protein
MKRLIVGIAWLCSGAAAPCVVAGQEVFPHRQDRIPNRPYSPEEALEAMRVPRGFAVELVAGEPEIVNPIAMTLDDRGRVWVTESLEYPRKEAGRGRRGTFDQLVASGFDPSLVIGPSYQTTTVVTEDGRNLTGLATEDSDQRMVPAMPGGAREVIPRNNVKYNRVSKLSMMPGGVESLLDRKELADLFAFLTLDRPPGDSQARPIPGAPGTSPR